LGCGERITVYATLAGTKERLDISHTQDDAEISNCAAYADGVVDVILRPHRSMPVLPTDQDYDFIVEVAEDLAALEYQRRRGNVDRGTDIVAEAEKRLRIYVAAHYSRGRFSRSGTVEEAY
jgi:hypothetical protein